MQLNPIAALFGGQSATAKLLNDIKVSVFVRALPTRGLPKFLSVYTNRWEVIEYCTYLKTRCRAGPASVDLLCGPMPAGYTKVPEGWADNLSGDSAADLYDLASKLNLQRALNWSKTHFNETGLSAPMSAVLLSQVEPATKQVMREISSFLPSRPDHVIPSGHT